MSDTEEDTAKKVMSAITDPQKVRKNDPGRPEVCNVFTYHTKFNVAEVDEIATTCRSGELGCVACKKNCAAKMNAFMAPIRERRLQFGKDEDVLNILVDGEKRGRLVAQQTMSEVREAMKLG